MASGNIKGAAPVGSSVPASQKVTTELPYDAAMSLLIIIYPEELKTGIQINTCT